MKLRVSRLARRLRLFLRVDPAAARTPADFRRAAVDVVWLARFYYLFVAFLMNTSQRPSRALAKGDPNDPLWPIALLNDLMGTGWVEKASGMPFLPAVCSIAGLLAVVFPGMMLGRLAVFAYLFVVVALQNSYDSINHGSHWILYIGFTMLFLPPAANRPDRMSRRDAMDCIMVFWFAQSLTLLTYFLSGFWKIYGSRLELLASDGFVRILLDRAMTDTGPVPPLLPILATQDWLSQMLFLGVIYVQISSAIVFFRPHLHKTWGIFLILFHVGTLWAMNIGFATSWFLLGLFMVFSPFAPRRFSWSALAQSLPLVGIPFRVFSRRPLPRTERAWLIYDGQCPLCRHYALYVNARKAVGELVLVDAREGGPLVEEVRSLRYDLDDGMVLKIGGRYFYGSEALHVLALLSEGRTFFGLVNRLLFSSRPSAVMAYPLFRFVRRILLKLKGVSQIPC